MTQIDALLDFAEHEMKKYFAVNKPNYKDPKDPLLIARKGCNAFIAQARKIKNGEQPDWVPSAQAVAKLLDEFAPGVYTCEITAVFNRKDMV